MNKISEKKAFWVDELPEEIKANIKNIRIEALIQSLKITNDPFCIALLCDYITPKNHQKKALQTIKDFALQISHKKGFRYIYKKNQILEMWESLKGQTTNANVYTYISSECGISEDAIRKIIKNAKM